ncbi:DUF554 domain-containing protein [Geomonas sp. RF6]|uniref:DUF554 domain-containing protein n=1 Tax=Geomonas sp. RF6 TaxID=2897342 RepID=UPI001E351B71|nr:DUF554 domain-containing protein [Geomonas sp. RF6]UFS68812.1 DUF554 domain-containing protein [Geomonas sp. RF6]
MIGPIVNASAVAVGCVIGFTCGGRLPERVRKNMPLTFGCASMTLGIAMIGQIRQIPAVIIALLLGSLCGELFDFQSWIERLTAVIYERNKEGGSFHGMTEENFSTLFSSLLVIFCFSGTGVVGSLNEGLTGDPSLLIVKSCLDFITAIVFSANIGYSLLLFVIPMFAVQSSLYAGAASINTFMTPVAVSDFKATGGILMLAAGFNLLQLKSFRLVNMLPAVFIILVVSGVWTRLMP